MKNAKTILKPKSTYAIGGKLWIEDGGEKFFGPGPVVKGRDGKEHNYSGVPVQRLLELAGVTTGKDLRGENLAKYLLVKCADGYEVVLSLAEIDSSFTDRIVLLADAYEGKPISAERGPFQLAVPGEKKPARSCFQVTEFIIKFAKE